MMSCIYFYQYTQARIPPESFRNTFEALAFSISMYQPVMHNHPKVFSRAILETNLGQKSRVIALCSAIPTHWAYTDFSSELVQWVSCKQNIEDLDSLK